MDQNSRMATELSCIYSKWIRIWQISQDGLNEMKIRTGSCMGVLLDVPTQRYCKLVNRLAHNKKNDLSNILFYSIYQCCNFFLVICEQEN